MANLFQSLRWVHIAAGSIALILFWIPAIARKGGRTHIRAGWVYVVCMSVVVVTAFAMSGLAFTIPVAVRQIARPFSPAELSDFLRVQRVFATFLAYLAGVTLASGWQGISRRTIAVFRDLLAELATLAGSPPDVLSQEVGATHPDHTKRSASLLAVLGQALAHNSYHIGQVVMMRSSLGAWPPKGGGDSW